MKKSFFILLVPLLLCLAHCKKQRSDITVVEGFAYEFGTKKALVGASIWIVGPTSGCTFGNCPLEEIANSRVKTDANGHYRIEFRHESAGYYEMRGFFKALYTFPTEYRVVVGEINSFKLLFVPPAWLAVHVKNVNPVNNNDSIVLNAPGFPSTTLAGTNINETRIRLVEGNSNQYITYWVTKRGIESVKRDSILCTGHDTTHYYLNY
jgi:hypothetical protein